MQVVLVVNTSSGRGRASRIADAIDAALREAGHEVAQSDLGQGLGPALNASEAVVVVGGDGTLHAVLDACAGCRVPVYHAPAGTENLFAREFGMTCRPADVVRAVGEGVIRQVDLARAGSRAFVLMASVGWDAGVIHALHKARRGAISHRSYVAPILAQLVAFPGARFDVRADGRPVIEGREGLLVIANSRQYAMRLDPARGARVDDGLLDLVFFPFRARFGLAGWSLRAMAGRHLAAPGVVSATAARFDVAAGGPGALLQLDGEAVDRASIEEHRSIAFTIEPGALRVLMPPG